MDKLWTYLGIGLGSALGGMGRVWIAGLVARHCSGPFPWAILCVNVTGSLAIGAVAALAAPQGPWHARPWFNHFLMAGVCGGYTTFSAFSLQTLELLRDGRWPLALANAALSVGLCLGATALGWTLAQSATR
jgi:CrcB protein